MTSLQWNIYVMTHFLGWRRIIRIFTFFSPGIRNYWKLFTVSVFGCIRNYLLIVTVYRHCSSRHYLCTDSIIVQTLFMQRFLQKNLELLLTITVRHCSLLCKTHYCAKQFAFTIHCIIMNVLFIIWFFHFHMPIYIYIYMTFVWVGRGRL